MAEDPSGVDRVLALVPGRGNSGLALVLAGGRVFLQLSLTPARGRFGQTLIAFDEVSSFGQTAPRWLRKGRLEAYGKDGRLLGAVSYGNTFAERDAVRTFAKLAAFLMANRS